MNSPEIIPPEPTSPSWQQRIDERQARIAAMDPNSQDAEEITRLLREEIDYLTQKAKSLGGGFTRIAITHVVRIDNDGRQKAIPLMPYDPHNVVHRIAREEGFFWPDTSRAT